MRLYGVTGWKNAGKTGLMERLVTEITGRGFTVSTLKHAHHTFDVDHPGKDSHRHRVAGATEVLLSSGNRWALMHELRGRSEPPLEMLLEKLAPVDRIATDPVLDHLGRHLMRLVDAAPDQLDPDGPIVVSVRAAISNSDHTTVWQTNAA